MPPSTKRDARPWSGVRRWTGTVKATLRGLGAVQEATWTSIVCAEKTFHKDAKTVEWKGTAQCAASWTSDGSNGWIGANSQTKKVAALVIYDSGDDTLTITFDGQPYASGVRHSTPDASITDEFSVGLDAAEQIVPDSPDLNAQTWPVHKTTSEQTAPFGTTFTRTFDCDLVAEPGPHLVKVSVVQGATQKNVTGEKNWAAVKSTATSVVVEATTAPKNDVDEWKQILWSGNVGKSVPGHKNRRTLSLDVSKKCHLEAALGGTSDYVDVWILWADVKILITGTRPSDAAPFDPDSRDNTDKLGAVTYLSFSESVIDEAAGVFVRNMGASGKVVPVATLSPKGVHAVVSSGWTFERRAWSRDWQDGRPGRATDKLGVPDTSNSRYLRLVPGADDKIYDLDAPDMRWGQKNFETYNNFQQWIEWNGEKCSDSSQWHWRARWRLDKDPNKQITLKDLGTGNIALPTGPYFSSP